MRHNNTPATATQINNLIALVQTAPTEEARASAIGQMWEQFGDNIVGIAAKQSYTMDYDFGYHVIIPVRRSRQSGKMGATIPDQGSHLFIVHLFGQIQRVVVARDFISLFARAACLQAA